MKNPFEIGDRTEMFGYKERKSLELKEERNTLKSMTLAERANLLKPLIPSTIIRSITNLKSKRSKSNSNLTFDNLKLEHEEGFKRMTEFIQEKREIYLVQLLIDKKEEEISKIKQLISNDEKELIEYEHSLSEKAGRYKLLTNKIESDLTKSRQLAEIASQKRIILLQKLKKQRNINNSLNSEISKNQDILIDYQNFKNFLNQFNNESKDFLKNPNNLIEEFNIIQSENLFLIRECDLITNLIKNDFKDLENYILNLSNNINKIEEIFEKKINNINILNDLNDNESEDLNKNLEYLNNIINKTFINCFHKNADLNSLTKLSKISQKLEEMYINIEFVTLKFIEEKQLISEKIRREEFRKETQLLKEKILLEKKEQALNRANKPIKKKLGRPLMIRTIPFKSTKNEDEKLKKLKLELEKQENLLFGLIE